MSSDAYAIQMISPQKAAPHHQTSGFVSVIFTFWVPLNSHLLITGLLESPFQPTICMVFISPVGFNLLSFPAEYTFQRINLSRIFRLVMKWKLSFRDNFQQNA